MFTYDIEPVYKKPEESTEKEEVFIDLSVVPRYPEWGFCPETCHSRSVSYYRGFLIHFWGGAYCCIPIQDGPYNEYDQDVYGDIHYISGKAVRCHAIMVTLSVGVNELEAQIVAFIDEKWGPFEEALRSFGT